MRDGAKITVGSWLVVALVAALLGGLACSDDGDDGDGADGRVRVVTSLELFADMARNVGGERVDVTALLPSGADPHTFEIAPRRVEDVARADVVFVNGLGLEGSLRDVVDENAGGPVVELTEGLADIDGNPHLWLDPTLAAGYVERIRDALSDVDPVGADSYSAAAAAYGGELDALDQDFASAVDAIAPERRKLVTFHDAYPYLASRYDLELVAVVVRSPGREPSARDVADLLVAIEQEAVPAVFKEPQFSAAVLELAADEAGVRVLDLLSGAYAEDVGSYLELMRFNLRQLEEGLGG